MDSFRIYGEPVWNLPDLQQKLLQYSPAAVLPQLDAFCDFAAIHCVPLSRGLPVADRNLEAWETEWKPVEYYTGKFWIQLLNRRETWDSLFLRDLLLSPPENNGLEEEQELEQLQLREKLACIQEKLSSDRESSSLEQAVQLLAVCELAQVDPRDVPASVIWQARPAGRAAILAEQWVQAQKSGRAELPAGYAACCLRYHDAEVLQPGEQIQIICLQAGRSRNTLTSLKLLVEDEHGRVAAGPKLEAGQCVWCSVAGGKLIEFLPQCSKSADQVLERPVKADSCLYLVRDNGTQRLQGTEKVCSFACGLQRQGWLLVNKNGKVDCSHYGAALRNGNVAHDLFMTEHAVGVRIYAAEDGASGDGYAILLENGIIRSDMPGKNGGQAITLNPENRKALFEHLLQTEDPCIRL